MSLDVRAYINEHVYQDCGELVEYLKSTGVEFPDSHSYDESNTDREIYSWYIVSDNFAGRAKKANYCIIENLGLRFFGRTDFGQALDTDSDFAKDFELV